MSSIGSPSTTSRSARRPGWSTPTSSPRRMNSLFDCVAERSASAGLNPSSLT